MEFIPQPQTGGADLHVHSNYSDGSHSPEEILERAREVGLSAISLTDHDTVAGLPELMSMSQQYDLDVIPGVELSCESHGGRYHILGYYIDWERPTLVKKLKYYEEERADRVRRMVEVLREETGTNIQYDEVVEQAGQSLMGKPHVAQAMVDRDIVSTVEEAFEYYLDEGMILDQVSKERMGVREAIQLIHEVNGVAVLAHPRHYEPDVEVQKLRNLGVEGIEVYYSDHDHDERLGYFEQASNLDLLVTGGSDFHGNVKPTIELGDVRLPEDYLLPLKKQARRRGSRFDLIVE